MDQTLITAEPCREDGCETVADEDPDPRSVHVESTVAAVEVDWLVDRLRAATALLALDAVDLSVIVIDDPTMARLHEQYGGVAGTTDVLTFDLRDASEGSPSAGVEGEVYVCRDEAARQAERRGHDPQRELLLYALHGLLHLIGYDDHEPDDHERMHAKEDELLTALGVGATFARRAALRDENDA